MIESLKVVCPKIEIRNASDEVDAIFFAYSLLELRLNLAPFCEINECAGVKIEGKWFVRADANTSERLEYEFTSGEFSGALPITSKRKVSLGKG